jgi:DNA-binding GntR family transcriptional regulator
MPETADPLPPPLRVRSVPGLAYDEIRSMIVDGRLQPGARVGQAELADALGISRGSVREALRRLTGDGLVAFEVNRGFFVADVGLDGVLERLEARLLLEPAIARLAAERRSEDDLAALRAAIEAERASTDAVVAHDATRSFHVALIEATGSATLLKIFDGLWIADVGRRLIASRSSQAAWRSSDAAEHEAILAAVAARDGAAAEQAMRDHVHSAWKHWAERPR